MEILFSKSKSVENFFFFIHLLPPCSLALNQGCHYPIWGLMLRDTRLCSWQRKKKHVQHFLKLLMFYPIIHRPETWEYVFVGKPWLDMVEPASLVPVSPGWHVWKLLPQSISKVQVLKYLSRQSCGGQSEHSSCTLKGYSESHIWARVHLEINGVPLTG